MSIINGINAALCSDIGRLVLAFLLVGGTFALLLTNHPVPDFLLPLVGAAVGFYFGGFAQVNRS